MLYTQSARDVMKRFFRVFIGHEKGGAGFRIIASNIGEVNSIFDRPGCQVFAEEEAPDWIAGPMKLESDLHDPQPWLSNLLYSFRMQDEGKTSFPVKGRRWGTTYYRNLWARDIKELRHHFPKLELQYYVPWDPEIEHSDVDVEDEFTRKFKSKGA